MESRFFEPLRKTKIGSKIRKFEKSGVKLQCPTKVRETTFGLISREVGKNGELSRNRDCTVYFLGRGVAMGCPGVPVSPFL